MDLLEDSGDEATAGKAFGELDENMLLNSDDEEGGTTRTHNNHNVLLDEEELLYEDADENFLDEPEDVLDLELGEDELDTPDCNERHVPPVKLREVHISYPEEGEVYENALLEDAEEGVTSTEDHEVSESSASSRLKSTADSDDEDEPRQRSRFLTERKTDDISRHSGPSEGNPIQTLGERSQRPTHGNIGIGKGNRGGFSGRGKQFGPRGIGMHPMRHRPQSLLGDRPRPALLRFPHMHPQQFQHGDPIRQLQGGFIDFNQPMIRPGVKGTKNNQHSMPAHSATPSNMEHGNSSAVQNIPSTQQNSLSNNININTVLSHPNIRNPRAMSPKRPIGPRPILNRTMRPRLPLVRNPFILVDPNLQGPRGPPRLPPRHPTNPNQPPFSRQQWPCPQLGPRGIPGVSGGNLMQSGLGVESQEQYNNEFHPPGLLGPPPHGVHPPFPDGIPPSGFRQPFIPPNHSRFSHPEEMGRNQFQLPHVQPQQVFMQHQNFPLPAEPLLPQPQHSPHYHGMRLPHEMEFPRHRAPAPSLHYNQSSQSQRPPDFRFQGQPESGWNMQHQQLSQIHDSSLTFHQHPHGGHSQQQLKGNSRPHDFRVEGHTPVDEHQNSFHDIRRRDDLDRSDGQFDDPCRENDHYSRDRYRDYDSGSSRDYHDRSERNDERRRYRDYDYDEKSSQHRPPMKRPSDSARNDFRPEKKGHIGSPEKRLDGRLGPPIQKNDDVVEEQNRQEQALKMLQESQKVTGVDSNYLRKIEEQKEMRARILREKEHRRKQQQTGPNSPKNSLDDDSVADSRREVRIVKSGKQRNQPSAIQTTEPVQQPRVTSAQGSLAGTSKVVTSKSIYINPRAFRGGLNALKSMDGGTTGIAHPVKTVKGGGSKTVTVTNTTITTASSSSRASEGASTNSLPATPGVPRKRTILRIVRNKKGEIISKSKVVVLPKGSLVGGTATAIQHTT